MDTLDHLLIDAWARLAPRIRSDRLAVARRARRRGRPILTRPPRAWCLALRASDTRLTGHDAHLDPPDALHPAQPHTVTLVGPVLRALCQPVHLPPPGVPHDIAAARLGVSDHVMRRWIRRGRLHVRYDPATVHGRRGRPVPVVWTPTPLDPGADERQPPDALWGTLWQHLYRRIPEAYMQTFQRVPRYRRWRGQIVQRGWDFLCPGRVRMDDTHTGCGRRCKKLLGPFPVWTLLDALGLDDPLKHASLTSDPTATSAAPNPPPNARPERREGRDPHPDADPDADLGYSFACPHCWQPQHLPATDPAFAWNIFVAHLSAGLLYGRDVPRPATFTPRPRRHREHASDE